MLLFAPARKDRANLRRRRANCGRRVKARQEPRTYSRACLSAVRRTGGAPAHHDFYFLPLRQARYTPVAGHLGRCASKRQADGLLVSNRPPRCRLNRGANPTHFLETGSVQKAGHRDEADDPVSIMLGLAGCLVPSRTKHLQRRPTPEIHIEVLEVMSMSTHTPLQRRHPTIHRRDAPNAAALNPATLATGLILVRRITNDYCDPLFFFDLVRIPP